MNINPKCKKHAKSSIAHSPRCVPCNPQDSTAIPHIPGYAIKPFREIPSLSVPHFTPLWFLSASTCHSLYRPNRRVSVFLPWDCCHTREYKIQGTFCVRRWLDRRRSSMRYRSKQVLLQHLLHVFTWFISRLRWYVQVALIAFRRETDYLGGAGGT